jgi:hypothetical protein
MGGGTASRFIKSQDMYIQELMEIVRLGKEMF